MFQSFKINNTNIFFLFLQLIIFIFSLCVFSPLGSPFINSDQAIHILMANSISIPDDLYYWNQDRLGSLLPILANLLVRIFHIESIYAITIILYGMLLGTWYFLSVFLENKFSKLLLFIVVFIPFPFFAEQVYVGHPYSAQFFFLH